jgi:hypothetical protein
MKGWGKTERSKALIGPAEAYLEPTEIKGNA